MATRTVAPLSIVKQHEAMCKQTTHRKPARQKTMPETVKVAKSIKRIKLGTPRMPAPEPKFRTVLAPNANWPK